jgi:hypothetical protein
LAWETGSSQAYAVGVPNSGFASAALAAALATAGLASCGESHARHGTEAAAVRRTIHAAIRAAVVDKDARAACAYATAAARARLVRLYGLSDGRRFRSCEQVVRFEVRAYSDTVVPRLRRSTGVVGAVRVAGATATARVSDQPGPYPASARVSLRKVGGHWLIDDSAAIPRGH